MSSLIETLIKKDRTYRRFDESVAIDRLQILRWLDVVRQTPSARNIQPLKYIIITDEASVTRSQSSSTGLLCSPSGMVLQ